MYFCIILENNEFFIVPLIINLYHMKDILKIHFYHFCLNYDWQSFQDTCIPNIELFFTVKLEANNSLSFYDSNIFRATRKLHVSVYRKLIFSNILIDFESCWPIFCKCHFIFTLLYRGFMICSSYRTLHDKSWN